MRRRCVLAESRIEFDARTMVANVATLQPKIRRAIRAAMDYHATRAVAYARANAPWTDRTSNARNGLFSTVGYARGNNVFVMVIGHSVPYGIWLEVRFAGRFAIIRPTVDHVGPQVMATAQTLVGRVLANG